MNYADEFKTVDIILESAARTRRVDAFTLSLIKAERQIRKLVTHLVFQFPCFGISDVPRLRRTLVNIVVSISTVSWRASTLFIRGAFPT